MSASATGLTEPADDSSRAWAQYFGSRGWRVAPVRPGENHPRLNRWPELATSDPEQIDRWWTRRPSDGVAIVTGSGSDLFVLDVDEGLHRDGSTKAGSASLDELEGRCGKLPETYTVCSPGGGRHLYFLHPDPGAIPDGFELRNSASHVGIDLDIRTEGGQVMAPPSKRKGGAYLRDLGSPDEVAVAPDWLVRLACNPIRVRHEAASVPARNDTPGDRLAASGSARTDRPGDRWAAATAWSAILCPLGFELVRTDSHGCSYWHVPGASNPTGATTNNGGRDTLHLFSSSCKWFNAGDDIGKVHVLAVTRFGGDHSAAARWCVEQGFGADPVPPLASIMAPRDRTDLPPQPAEPTAPGPPAQPAPLGGPQTLLAQATGVPLESAVSELAWGEPIPLGGITQLPTFPGGVFPDWMEAMIDSVATELQQSRDIAAMAVLGALTAVTSGRLSVDVDGRQIEQTNLYLTTAAPPSAGKSPAHKAMWGPVIRAHQERVRRMAVDIASNASRLRVAQAKLKKLENAKTNDPAAVHQAVRAVMEAKQHRTTDEQLTVADATPEALEVLMAANGGRMTISDTEGGVFEMMAGKYSEQSAPETYLKGWSSDAISVSRIGRDAVEVEVATLALSLCVQPIVVEELGRRPGFSERGVTSRFLIVMPPSLPPWEKDHRRQRISAEISAVRETYSANLGQWATVWLEGSARLRLSDEALEAWAGWNAAVAERQRPGCDLADMSDWAGKLNTSVVRLAAILHSVHGLGGQTEIGVPAMERAIACGEYWASHAAHIHELWRANDDIVDARAILRWAIGRNSQPFSIRELYRALRNHFPSAADTQPGLALLIERGLLRTVDGQPLNTATNGKSTTVEVHPGAKSEAADPRTEAVTPAEAFKPMTAGKDPASAPAAQPRLDNEANPDALQAEVAAVATQRPQFDRESDFPVEAPIDDFGEHKTNARWSKEAA